MECVENGAQTGTVTIVRVTVMCASSATPDIWLQTVNVLKI